MNLPLYRATVVCFLASLILADLSQAQFTASGMTLYDHVPLNQMGGGSGADIWGWTDSDSGREYALFARSSGTSFFDVTDPSDAVYLGNLPSRTGSNDVWRDVKTYGNFAYIVADGNVSNHGLQVFDLTNLRGVTTPQTFSTTAFDTNFNRAHNIAINEESGYAYVVGTAVGGGVALVYDLANLGTPASPQYLGPVQVDGYVHDLQVVNYRGPDPDHFGREIMFTASRDDFVIIDVEDKTSPFLIWEDFHPGTQYIHQGWLSEDHSIFFMGDELDTRWTHKWDISDLDAPVYLGFESPTAGTAIDHNLYVKGKYTYEANYTSGLRLFEITDLETADISEVAWLDTYPNNDAAVFSGAWSVYPFFESGTIITSDINGGLFVSRVDILPPDFNADGYANCTDINQLTAAIANGSDQPWFDLNDDDVVDQQDIDSWLVQAGQENLGGAYSMGDINLDGLVDNDDYDIWNANRFTQNHDWCSGDLNADGFISGRDLLLWNANKTLNAQVVPEPQALLVLLIGGLALVARRRA